jgi:hypothetical protein
MKSPESHGASTVSRRNDVVLMPIGPHRGAMPTRVHPPNHSPHLRYTQSMAVMPLHFYSIHRTVGTRKWHGQCGKWHRLERRWGASRHRGTRHLEWGPVKELQSAVAWFSLASKAFENSRFPRNEIHAGYALAWMQHASVRSLQRELALGSGNGPILPFSPSHHRGAFPRTGSVDPQRACGGILPEVMLHSGVNRLPQHGIGVPPMEDRFGVSGSEACGMRYPCDRQPGRCEHREAGRNGKPTGERGGLQLASTHLRMGRDTCSRMRDLKMGSAFANGFLQPLSSTDWGHPFPASSRSHRNPIFQRSSAAPSV